MISFFYYLPGREFRYRSGRTDIDQLFDPVLYALVNYVCSSVNIDGMNFGIRFNLYPDNARAVNDIDFIVFIGFEKPFKRRIVQKVPVNDLNSFRNVLFCGIPIQDERPYPFSFRQEQTADIASQKAGSPVTRYILFFMT